MKQQPENADQTSSADRASPTSNVIKLKDYRPPAFKIDSVDLLFRIFDEEVIVEAKSRIERSKGTPSDAPLMLHGSPFYRLKGLKVDGRPVADDAFSVDKNGDLTLHRAPDIFELDVITALNPAENTRLEGLYQSNGNYCTQCEAEGFRHITYFLDRPDILCRYRVRIEADAQKYPVLLSNGNLLEQGDLPGGRHYVIWDDPHPKPCYLFALVAADLACLSDQFITRSGKSVELNIYAASDDIDKCGFAMQSLKNAMRWDEDQFDLEYDLDIYNIVAVSDFNMGAMENKGLNIFNTKYVLASPATATDQDYANIEGVIGHEYFHNWTGNRITCRDWFQLSLKEGLTVYRDQEFSSDMGSRAIKRLDDVRVLRTHQFPEDSGPLAHPIRPEQYVEINNFYTATVYNKGAEVIRMIHTLIGPAAFKRGMQVYVERHDGTAATCEDFVQAMEAGSNRDLSQFRHWYARAGTPHLKFERLTAPDGSAVLKVTQEQPPTRAKTDTAPYHIPIRVGWVHENRDTNGDIRCDGHPPTENNDFVLELTEETQEFHFTNIPEDAVPSLLKEFTAPVTFDHDLTTDDLLKVAALETDPFVATEAIHSVASDILIKQLASGHVDEAIKAKLFETLTLLLRKEGLDRSMQAELLTIPSEGMVGQSIPELDPQKLHHARDALIVEFAAQAEADILALYHQMQDSDGGEGAASDLVANRRLKNTLLDYIATRPEGQGILARQYAASQNMTDKLAAFTAIVASNYDDRGHYINDFYNQWRGDALVIDKWFAAQAAAPRPEAVSDVRALTKHQDFSYLNPNRLRALIASYSVLNQVGFHNENGEGYALLAETIMRVDTSNPQIAARLLSPLGQWRRFNPSRQKKMKYWLEKIISHQNISADVAELAEKSIR